MNQWEIDKFISTKIEPIVGGEVKLVTLWQETVAHYLRKEALAFCGQVIVSLKEKGISWAIYLADWLIIRLEDYLLLLYEQASNQEKEAFRWAILSKFRNSQLAKRLERKIEVKKDNKINSTFIERGQSMNNNNLGMSLGSSLRDAYLCDECGTIFQTFGFRLYRSKLTPLLLCESCINKK